jgi:predicted Rossmann fold flavoprotein
MEANGYDLVVIGGGAAGYFAAITAADALGPAFKVIIAEKTGKCLTKVSVSGGGRCNVSHSPKLPLSQFVRQYPRGEKALKRMFMHFSAVDSFNWFQKNGVHLKIEGDGRVFPKSDSSASIVNCLVNKVNACGVRVHTGMAITAISRQSKGFKLITNKEETLYAKAVLIASGGSPKSEGLVWLNELGLKTESPVPSLFTFNIPQNGYGRLKGVSVPNAKVKISGSKLQERGPLLITHWGLSGPVILRLSSWGARELADKQYNFDIQVQWNAEITEEKAQEHFAAFSKAHPKKFVTGNPMFGIPSRLWEVLVSQSLDADKIWAETSKKELNRLMERIIRHPFQVKGKTTFKEEFVTCGGLSLQEVNWDTLECNKIPGLYFAGEILDIDGITGGFNFQAAWTTGWIAGNAIAQKLKK